MLYITEFLNEYLFKMNSLVNMFQCVEIKDECDPNSRILKYRRPDLYKQIDRSKYTLQELTKIDIITYGSNKKLWWICPLNPCGCHIYESAVKERTRPKATGCSFCSSNKTCMHSSFMSIPSLKSEYEYNLNPGVDPYKIPSMSSQMLTWRCQNHKTCNEHIWCAPVSTRSTNHGCPYCTHNNDMVCRCDSIMNHEIMKFEFDPNLNPGINPYRISCGSGQILTWRCSLHETCNQHIWSVSHAQRTLYGCPFCVNQYVCECNTFMNDENLKLLKDEFDHEHPQNINIDPNKLSFGSNIKVWWKCINCKFSWNTTPNHRTNGNTNCPSCANLNSESKGELRCREYLEESEIISYSQISLSYIPSRKYDFAFIINSIKYLIEYDGEQHFKYNNHWYKNYDNFLERQEVDKIKTLIPLILGYNILRISNDDIDHIKMCINKILYITINFENQLPLIVFDDISKYQHLINNFNRNTIIKLCNVQFHEEIISKFMNFKITIYDIKTDNIIYKFFDMNNTSDYI